MGKNLTTPDIYEYYTEQGGDLDYDTFASVCESFNQKIMEDVILQGGVFNQGSYMGELSVLKIPRNYKKKHVNWSESLKLKEELLEEGKKLYDSETGEGHKWLVYYSDPWFCRFYWTKYKCRVKNRELYQFYPTRGKTGNATKLNKLLEENELAHTRFNKAENVNLKYNS